MSFFQAIPRTAVAMALVTAWLTAFLVSAPAFAQVSDGQEIVVYEQSIPALIRIDPVTGQQRMIKHWAQGASHTTRPGESCG